MGIQELGTRAVFGRTAADQGWLLRIALLASSVAMTPFVAGCSSFSSPFSGGNANANQAASVPPPPNYPAAAAGQQAYPPPAAQPAYAARPGQPAYAPPPGQPAYAPPPGQQAYAPPPQAPPPEQNSSVGSLRQGYVNFLQAFRDPPEPDPSAPPANNARASVYPQQASMPHPPGTYVPSQQPYVPPPQGQPAYGQPAQQNYPPPPVQGNYAQPPAQQGYAPRPQSYAAPPAQPDASDSLPYPKQSLADVFRGSTEAPPSTNPTDSLPYPKQSLADAFRGSTQTQSQTMPHPPGTYTPSAQPYTPPGQQPAYGTPAPAATAAAPPANSNSTDSLPYPKQSLSDIFSSH